MTFGEKLKQARKNAAYSQEELAEKLAVSRSAVAKWETDKGMPDVSNIKSIAQLLNVSIDYLLDDGTRLDFSTTRKPINLSDYSDKKITVLNKKRIKDKVVRAEYPDAEICTLMGEEKLTKSEKVVDTAIWLLTPLIDMVKLAKGLNNIENEFYLVNQNDRQIFVVVTDEYIESRELIEKIIEKKFVIGNWRFRNCGPIKYA
jgi:transcriptional regulator with XRE-family HTH domain